MRPESRHGSQCSKEGPWPFFVSKDATTCSKQHVGLLDASQLHRAGALDPIPGAGCESPVGLISVLPGAFRSRCLLIAVKSLLWRNRSLQHFFPRLPK